MLDLFSKIHQAIQIKPGVFLLPGFACLVEAQLLADLGQAIQQSPFRHMMTPGGYRMSVAMTNCGQLGWISDRQGYRYADQDPLTESPWPRMPTSFRDLAQQAAAQVGFGGFLPTSCLINHYEPGAKMSLHQDKDEADFTAPLVSVSLGLPAIFKIGGCQRTDPLKKVSLSHGDVIVWGNEARLAYHGILPIKEGFHPLLGRSRLNLTFRKAD